MTGDRLTHQDETGRARMVDVGGKPVTRRTATAAGRLVTTPEVARLLRADGLPKADALTTARIAGIAGAKRTGDLIPLSHPLPLDQVTVDLTVGEDAVSITATASATGRTGVEMEALTAVAIAGLTLHDMVKAVDPAASLTDVRLLEKHGGTRGTWTREGGRELRRGLEGQAETSTGRPASVGIAVVVSTGVAQGTRQDTTGPLLVAWLREGGLQVGEPRIVADADVGAALLAAIREQPAVLLTTGGTGPGPSDRTPEATTALLDRTLPGIAEAIRARGLRATPTAALGRGLAGQAGRTIVVNLPGSAGGVTDGLEVLGELMPHLLRQVRGGADHEHGAHQSPAHQVEPPSARP